MRPLIPPPPPSPLDWAYYTMKTFDTSVHSPIFQYGHIPRLQLARVGGLDKGSQAEFFSLPLTQSTVRSLNPSSHDDEHCEWKNDSISVFYTKDFYFNLSVLTKGVLCTKFALPPPSFWGVLVLYIAFSSHIKMYYFTSHKEKKWHSVFVVVVGVVSVRLFGR